MPNVIKYSTSPQTLALKSGNYWIGTGDVGKGPTSSSDYWNGITPPTSGYTIYINKASQGPSIYTPLSDSDLVITTNMIAQTSFTSVTECFNWFNTQSDKMVFNIDYPPIITNGLVLNLDAGFRPSYSTSGVTWYDLSPNGNNGTLVNGPTFSSANGGIIVFDGVNDYVNCGSTSNLTGLINITTSAWVYPITSSNTIFVSRYWNTTGNQGWLLGYINSAFFFSGRESSAAFLNISTSSIFPINGWYNVVGTKSGSLWSIYVNGNLQNSSNLGNGTTPFANNNVQVGALASLNIYQPNRVASTQIYNRALSATEVLQNYNATKSRFGL